MIVSVNDEQWACLAEYERASGRKIQIQLDEALDDYIRTVIKSAISQIEKKHETA